MKRCKFGILFFILFSTHNFAAEHCRLKTGPVLSLSGPITHYLSALSLLQDPQLKAISSFHGIGAPDFSGEILSGGIFLSQAVVKKFRGSLVFLDESVDLQKKFAEWPKEKIVLIKSRGKDPFEVADLVEQKLIPFLEGCEKQRLEVRSKWQKIDESWKKSAVTKVPVFFFMGKLSAGQKLPDLVMRDGFVLYLEKTGKIVTYPSELSYIPWSAKILKEWEVKKQVVKIGVDQGPKLEIVENNVLGPHLFIPGPAQITLLEKLQPFLEQQHALKLHPTHSP